MEGLCSRFQIMTPPDASNEGVFLQIATRVGCLDALYPLAPEHEGGLAAEQGQGFQAHTQKQEERQVRSKDIKPTRQASSNNLLQHFLQKKIHEFHHHLNNSSDEESEEHDHRQHHHHHKLRHEKDSLKPAEGSLLGTPRLKDFYKLQQELGRGHLGVVSLVRCRGTRRLFACKTFFKKTLIKRRFVDEVKTEILATAELQLKGNPTLGHNGAPFFVRVHEVFDDAEAVHLITDYCEGGDLLHYVIGKGCMSEAECASMLLQLMTALQDMHRHGLVHRDIKPDNILLTKKEEGNHLDLPHFFSHHHLHHGNRAPCFKLADFGSCAWLQSAAKVRGLAGSPKYMAPEVVQNDEYGEKVDVWSLGVVLYACLAGRQPFVGQATDDVFKAIRTTSPDLSRPPWPAISQEARNLVAAMLTKDPDKRITLTEIWHHPWVMKFNNSVLAEVTPVEMPRPISLHC